MECDIIQTNVLYYEVIAVSSLNPSDENKFGGKWSVKKLECVEAYLDSYLTVMKNQSWATLWYIDAFSGDGYQFFKSDDCSDENLALFEFENSRIEEFTMGSAMRAIELSSKRESCGKRAFDQFVFLEYNENKLAALEERIRESHPDQIGKCLFIPGDVNNTLPDLLAKRNWESDRAVTFVDPCATQLEWSAIESFEGTCSDVWLLFPLSSILRLMPREKMPSSGNAKRLTKLFGSSSWDGIYHDLRPEQLALFGNDDGRPYRESGYEELLAYTTERYKTVFPEVCGYAVLKTEKNAPLFALYSMVANISTNARNTSRKISQHLIRQLEG